MTQKKLITEIVHKKCPCRCHKPQEEGEAPVHCSTRGEMPCCPSAGTKWDEAPIA